MLQDEFLMCAAGKLGEAKLFIAEKSTKFHAAS